jgi:antitoxin VapB
MPTARVFWSGNSQAVRIPKEFQLRHREVEITRKGNALVLRPLRRTSWGRLLDSLERFTPDYLTRRPRQPRRDRRSRAFR